MSEAVDAPQTVSDAPTGPTEQSEPQAAGGEAQVPQSGAPTGSRGPLAVDSADEYASPVRQAPSPSVSLRRSPIASPPRQPPPTLVLTSDAGLVPEPEGTVEAVEEMGATEETPRETPQMDIPGNVPDSAKVAQIEGGGASGVDEEAEELEELREISAVAAKLVEVSALPLKSFCS